MKVEFCFFHSWLRHHPPLGLLASKIPNGETALKFIILACVQKVTAKLLKKSLMNCPPGEFFFGIWLFSFWLYTGCESNLLKNQIQVQNQNSKFKFKIRFRFRFKINFRIRFRFHSKISFILWKSKSVSESSSRLQIQISFQIQFFTIFFFFFNSTFRMNEIGFLRIIFRFHSKISFRIFFSLILILEWTKLDFRIRIKFRFRSKVKFRIRFSFRIKFKLLLELNQIQIQNHFKTF